MHNKVPNPTMQQSVDGYIDQGLPVGSFLYWLLANNLQKACAHADDTNKRLIFEWVQWLWTHAPATCWGSEDKVNGWLDRHHRQRNTKDKNDAFEINFDQ